MQITIITSPIHVTSTLILLFSPSTYFQILQTHIYYNINDDVQYNDYSETNLALDENMKDRLELDTSYSTEQCWK